MKPRIQFVLTIGALWAGASQVHAQATAQSMEVRFHDNLIPNFAQVTIDNAFSDASARLADGAGGVNDITCAVTLADTGDAVTFNGNQQSLVITTEAGYLEARNAAGYVAIVQSIGWCGGSGGPFAGCGWQINQEQGYVITDSALNNTATHGVLMAHEFGHTVGAQHQTLASNIMRGTLATGNRRLTSNDAQGKNQCAFYQETVNQNGCTSTNAQGGPAAAAAGGGGGAAASAAATEDFSDVSIEDLATNGFIDTVPTEVEDFYGEEDVEILKDMLADPDQAKHHGTILSLIGLISDGSSDDVQAIVSYAKSKKGNRHPIGLALGYLVNRTGNQEALSELIAKGQSGKRAERHLALMGMGLSAHPQALAELEDLSPAAGDADVVQSAVNDNYEISEVGLAGYYKKFWH